MSTSCTYRCSVCLLTRARQPAARRPWLAPDSQRIVTARTSAYHCGQMCVMKPAAALDEVAELAGEDLESLRQYSRLTSDIHTVKLT